MAKIENKVAVRGSQISITNLSFENEEVASFLKEQEKPEIPKIIEQSIIVGCAGLKSMGVRTQTDYVQKEFEKLLVKIDSRFDSQQIAIQKKIDETFSLKKKDSDVSKLYKKFEDTFDEKRTDSPMWRLAKHLEDYFGDKNGKVRELIDETFDIDNNDTPLGELRSKLDLYFDEKNGRLKILLEKSLDSSDSKSPLGQFTNHIDAYLKPNTGSIYRLLEKNFDLNQSDGMLGKFAAKLDQNFDVDKGTIRKILNPHDKTMPIGQLREELLTELTTIRTSLATKQASFEIEQRTPIKGKNFEDIVYTDLRDLVQPYDDRVADVRTKTGRNGKTGDFIVDVDGKAEKRIVIEAKSREKLTDAEVEKELDRAIDNRSAKFGIFLFSTRDELPKSMQPIKTWPNKVVTSAENLGLYLSFRLARTLIEAQSESKQSINVHDIQEAVIDLRNKLALIDKIGSQTTRISTAADTIQSYVGNIRTEFEDGLDRIEKTIRKTEK